MIEAKIVAHSSNVLGQEIASVICTFPRFILAELNTHRMFSRNSASSRAIPFQKMVGKVSNDPFVPIAWQMDHKGMQGTDYITDEEVIGFRTGQWLGLTEVVINGAIELSSPLQKTSIIDGKTTIDVPDGKPVTKQLANRWLEPAMWHTVLITATEWNNFFELRCPEYVIPDSTLNVITDQTKFKSRKQLMECCPDFGHNFTTLDWLKINKGGAEIHMSLLAEAIYDAIRESTPKELQPGEWHIPFGDNIVAAEILEQTGSQTDIGPAMIKIATARCARTSYDNFDGGSHEYEKDIKLHDTLLKAGHMSPFEHCAQAMGAEDYDNYILIENGKSFPGVCRNFVGFKQYRAMIEAHL